MCGSDKAIDTVTCGDCFNQILKENKISVIVFTASWCKACKNIKPVMKQWASELTAKVKFAEVDVNIGNEIARRVGVEAMPTFVIYKKGKEHKRVVGNDTEKVRRTIDHLLERKRSKSRKHRHASKH